MFDWGLEDVGLVIQMAAHAVSIEIIVRHATLDASRGSSGNGADRGTFLGALFAAYDGTHSRSA